MDTFGDNWKKISDWNEQKKVTMTSIYLQMTVRLAWMSPIRGHSCIQVCFLAPFQAIIIYLSRLPRGWCHRSVRSYTCTLHYPCRFAYGRGVVIQKGQGQRSKIFLQRGKQQDKWIFLAKCDTDWSIFSILTGDFMGNKIYSAVKNLFIIDCACLNEQFRS